MSEGLGAKNEILELDDFDYSTVKIWWSKFSEEIIRNMLRKNQQNMV